MSTLFIMLKKTHKLIIVVEQMTYIFFGILFLESFNLPMYLLTLIFDMMNFGSMNKQKV